MTLQPLQFEFPYRWGKFYFIFYQCTFWLIVYNVEMCYDICKEPVEDDFRKFSILFFWRCYWLLINWLLSQYFKYRISSFLSKFTEINMQYYSTKKKLGSNINSMEKAKISLNTSVKVHFLFLMFQICVLSNHGIQSPHCKDTIPKIRNKYSRKRNCAASISISKFVCLWAIYIFPRSVCLFCCRMNVKIGTADSQSFSGNT